MDLDRHDVNDVSRLIYLTDVGLFGLVFGKDVPKAQDYIAQLIRIGNNSFGKDVIYVATDDDNKVVGALIAYGKSEKDAMDDDSAFSKIFSKFRLLRLLLLDRIGLSRLVTVKLSLGEFYISNISVDPAMRGRGVGTFIMDNAKRLAAERDASELILDVSKDNPGAIRLYERLGFVQIRRNSLFLGLGPSTYTMKCKIK